MTREELQKEIDNLQQNIEDYKIKIITADGAIQAFRYVLSQMDREAAGEKPTEVMQ